MRRVPGTRFSPARRSAVHGAVWLLSRVLLLALVVACGSQRGLPPRPVPPSADPEWFARNGPLLAEYLKTLPPHSVGQPLKGIRLSGDPDEARWLEGQVYRGVPNALPQGVGVRLMDDGERVVAYVWVEPGADGYVLEPCESGEQEGIRARLAGGGAHAWETLESRHGVVYTTCPPADWLSAESRDPSSEASAEPR